MPLQQIQYRQGRDTYERTERCGCTTAAHHDRCKRLSGKPCIRGLRYPVETLLELLSAGMTVEEILAGYDYEDLERADVLAALVFATRLSQVKRMQPIVGGMGKEAIYKNHHHHPNLQ